MLEVRVVDGTFSLGNTVCCVEQMRKLNHPAYYFQLLYLQDDVTTKQCQKPKLSCFVSELFQIKKNKKNTLIHQLLRCPSCRMNDFYVLMSAVLWTFVHKTGDLIDLFVVFVWRAVCQVRGGLKPDLSFEV